MRRSLIQNYQLGNQKLFGVGNLIMGTVSLYEICKNLDIDLYVEYTNHPISNFLNNHNKPLFTCNKDTVVVRYSMQTWRKKEFIKNLFKDHNIVNILYGCWVDKNTNPITEGVKTYIKETFKPNERLIKALNVHKQILGEEYNSIQIRLGDLSMESEKAALAIYPQIKQYLKTLDTTTPLFVTSDNRYIKDIIRNDFNVYCLDNQPIHLGNVTEYPVDMVFKRVEETLCDMFILFGSKGVVGFSMYSGLGTGFTELAKEIYDVPVMYVQQLDWDFRS